MRDLRSAGVGHETMARLVCEGVVTLGLHHLMPAPPRYGLGAKSGEGRTVRNSNVVLLVNVLESRFQGL